MSPDELIALADRIDSDQLWKVGILERDGWDQEQKDRLDAGVSLRRYADEIGIADKKREVGKEYIRGYKLTREDYGSYHIGCGSREWHVAINRYSQSPRFDLDKNGVRVWPRMMYKAKMVSDELPRMIMLFEMERVGLPAHQQHCSRCEPVKINDNCLTCTLGTETRNCGYLIAIESSNEMTNEAKDEAKAWTCMTHILLEIDENRHVEEMMADKSQRPF